MTGADGHLRRTLLTAGIDDERAARRESAAVRQIGEIGRRAGNGLEPCALDEGAVGAALQETDGVGMPRRPDDVADAAFLDDPPRIHDEDAVGDLDGGAEIVRHEDHRQAEVALQFAQQEEDLDLHGGVEGGGRLVGQQHLRPAGERQGDHGPLAHAARHLVRVRVEPALRGGDAHPLQQRQRPGARVSPADPFVPQDGFRDLVAEGIDRIEGEQRLLEDHRHDGAAEIRQLAAAHRQHVAAGDGDAALDRGPVLRMQAEERAQGDALAGARLADQGDDLARSHVEIDAVDGAHRRRARR